MGGPFMAPHSLLQPFETLSSPTGSLQPLTASRSPPYGLLQLSEADVKEGMPWIQTRAKKNHSPKVDDANHYTTAPSTL
jgi:hypothetical protein